MNKLNLYAFRILLMLFFGAVFTTGCTVEAETPIPLPTAKVPSLLEIDGAIRRWEGGNNHNYFVSVEETTSEGTFIYRVVIFDDEIRAAQRLERLEGKWQQPIAISSEEAAGYTVDALLARVLRDAKGEGPAPLNMFTLFDSFSGYPSLVEAKAIPSYTEDGRMRLNREYSYTISVSVEVLLEETFGLNKTPILTYNRSGGETAACSTLKIFDDQSSIYSDDCRQILLQLNPPGEKFDVLQSMFASLEATEDDRTDDSGAAAHLVLHGSGAAAPNTAELDQLWTLAADLNDLLSKPIGAGVTLLIWNGNGLVGIDMRTNLEQPAALDFRAPFYGGITDNAGSRLIFADGEGLKWLDLSTGDTGTYGANPTGQHYIPQAMTGGEIFVLQRLTESSQAVEWGWISVKDRSWHPLPAEITCISGVRTNPVNDQIAVIATPSADCDSGTSLWLVDPNTGNSMAVDTGGAQAADAAWAPDASALAYTRNGTAEDGAATGSLILYAPDSSTFENLFSSSGVLTGVTWSKDGEQIYFGLNGAGQDVNGLQEFDIAAGAIRNSLVGEELSPISFDPTGEFLAFRQGTDLQVWLTEFGQVIPITRDFPVDNPFVGWINSAGNN